MLRWHFQALYNIGSHLSFYHLPSYCGKQQTKRQLEHCWYGVDRTHAEETQIQHHKKSSAMESTRAKKERRGQPKNTRRRRVQQDMKAAAGLAHVVFDRVNITGPCTVEEPLWWSILRRFGSTESKVESYHLTFVSNKYTYGNRLPTNTHTIRLPLTITQVPGHLVRWHCSAASDCHRWCNQHALHTYLLGRSTVSHVWQN